MYLGSKKFKSIYQQIDKKRKVCNLRLSFPKIEFFIPFQGLDQNYSENKKNTLIKRENKKI